MKSYTMAHVFGRKCAGLWNMDWAVLRINIWELVQDMWILWEMAVWNMAMAAPWAGILIKTSWLPKCTQMKPNALKWSLARFYAKENDEAEVPPGSPYKWYSPNLLLKSMSSAAGYILGRFRFSRFIMMGNFSLPAPKNFPILFPPFTFRSLQVNSQKIRRKPHC